MIKYKGKPYCDTKEAATLLDIPEYTIRRLINSKDLSKKIPAEKVDGKSYGILANDLFEYAKENGKEDIFRANIYKLQITQAEKKLLLDITVDKASPISECPSFIASTVRIAFPAIAAALDDWVAHVANNMKSSNKQYADEEDIKQNQTNAIVQDSNLIPERNMVDILFFSLEYFKNQTELLGKTREELDYLFEQTQVSIRGIRINLKKAKEEDAKDQLKVMEHALEIQKIKIKSAISKFEKVTSK